MEIISTVAVFISIPIFLGISKFKQFIFIIFAALLPISFGTFGPIEEYLWIEWMAPLFALGVFYDLVINKRNFYSKEAKIFIVAVFILLIWSIISYLRFPVSAQKLMGASVSTSGIRVYYRIIINVFIFLSIYLFVKNNFFTVDSKSLKILKWISFTVLILGIIRLFGYFFYFDIPLIYGTFDYEADISKHYMQTTHRIGGLTEVASIGISAVMARLYFRSENGLILWFLMLAFLVLTILSGGRTALAGIILSLAVYAVLFVRRQLIYVIIAVVTLVLLGIALFPELFAGQLNRFNSLQFGFSLEGGGRDLIAYLHFLNFLQNPIFGKGIGFYSGYIGPSNWLNEFVSDQMLAGGHGSYYSIMGIFGLGGVVYFFTIVFGSIYKSYKKIKTLLLYNKRQPLLMFIFLLLIIKSVEYIAGGNGHGDHSLFLLVGILAGLLTLKLELK